MNTIWSFKTARFRVTLDWSFDDSPDLSWADDDEEIRGKIESGEYGVFCFRVLVFCDGREVGCAYLGDSIYTNPADFRDHIGLAASNRRDGCNYGSYFSDMVGEAIREARKSLKNPPYIRAA